MGAFFPTWLNLSILADSHSQGMCWWVIITPVSLFVASCIRDRRVEWSMSWWAFTFPCEKKEISRYKHSLSLLVQWSGFG